MWSSTLINIIIETINILFRRSTSRGQAKAFAMRTI